MKEATIHLKLTREHEMVKHHVTPLEVMLLVAEHNKNVGDVPVKVDEKSITDTTGLFTETVDNPHVPGAKREDVVRKPQKRSLDDELDRLRGIYGSKKVDEIVAKVKDLPTDDFKQGIDRGMKLTLPDKKLSETRLL